MRSLRRAEGLANPGPADRSEWLGLILATADDRFAPLEAWLDLFARMVNNARD